MAALKNELAEFVKQETELFYDENAEAALMKVRDGEVDVNELTEAWAKVFSKVASHILN